ncbi:hypothetical protein BIV57_08635 [Mangrovactinospora gilvigrisea]|uniref:Hyaluronate lyase n=1 Tax=Mangrovactinospora gilvigrisea TaxID=1428644 RepID=A0A1J7C8Q2_9ACTN|nr:hypothetical protein BIV57_08635 [Mangrovactinospora gilvigrisea]
MLLGGTALAAAAAVPFALAAPAGAASASSASSASPASSAASGADDFAAGRAQWLGMLVGSGWDPGNPALAAALQQIETAATAARAKLVPAGQRTTSLFSDVTIPADHSSSSPVSTTAARLKALALGWATPGTATHGDAGLLADIADGLDWFTANPYATGVTEWANWFDWEIGVPLALNDAVLLIFGSAEATADRVAQWIAPERHFVPSVPLTGTKGAAANRVNLCDAVLGRALLTEDADETAAAISALEGVLVYKDGTTAADYTRDGFYSDGSFTQHIWFPYAAGYGSSLFTSLANILGRAAGTRWAVTDPIIAQWVHRSFEPLFWRGAIMDMTAGRDVSFATYSDLGSGRAINRSILMLLSGLSDADRPSVAAFVKRNLLDADGTTPPTGWPIPAIVAADALLADASTAPRGPLAESHVFGVMDRAVHRTADWAVGIAMNSPRIAGYETGNNENLRGWYTGDGMTYLYTDNQQYGGGYWCTVNPYRLPGTTVDTAPRQLVNIPWATEYRNPEPWVGGAALDADSVAAVGMRLKADDSALTCTKSWFCLPDRVVALGAGITDPGGPGAVTTVEHRRLTGSAAGESAALLVDGTRLVPGDGDSAAPDGVRWAHLEGTAGYVFPRPVTLHALRETRTGAYTDIDHGSTGTGGPSYTNRFLTLHLDHGADAENASYAYVLLPGASARRTADEARDPSTSVVANTPEVQAVRDARAGVLAANVFAAGGGSADGGFARLRSEGPLSAVLRKTGATARVAVSDPTQTADTVTLDVLGHWTRVTEAQGITARRIPGGLRLTATTESAAGAPRTATLG